MIDLERHAEGILTKALQNGGDLAEVFVEERSMTSLRLEDKKLEKVVTGTESGAGVRVICGERTFYGHTNDLSEAGITRLAEVVAAGARGEQCALSFGAVMERHGMPVKEPAQEVSTARKIDAVHAADHAARARDPRLVQVAVNYADAFRRVQIANSQGRLVEDARPQIVFMVQVVGSGKGAIQTGMHFVGGRLGWELFEEDSPESVANEAARQACLMLDSDPAPTGRMPVVLSSSAGGTMIHEAVGHGLEADLVDKGMSKFGGRLGEQVAVPEISVVDDGTLPGKRGTTSVDDEGTPTQRTMLVEGGRLVRYMCDWLTARKLGYEPTGNGRRESYQCRPIPRMTNTLILPGKHEPEDIISATGKGLFVRNMGGGQVNTLNGDFVFEASEAYLIRNGKVEAPVRGATLIGNGPEVLMSIEAVGNDLGFNIGTCGKSGQGAPVSDAQPTLRIRELTIGGTAG